MTKFQIIVLAVFILAIIGGAASFALYKGSGSAPSLPNITVWGTFPASIFDKYVSDLNNSRESSLKITYVQQRPEDFSSNFVNALALGQGPDAVLLPTEMLLPQINKLAIIPYTALSKNTYFNSYIDQARIYLTDDGILALPFTVDPLVMYWNRDIFNSAGIAKFPTYWDEFVGTDLKSGIVQKLTSKDANGNIRRSALAMGDFSNMTNPREVLGSLLLQLGNPVTARDSQNVIVSTIDPYYSANPVSAFKFFSQFSDPANPNYSWNRGMPNDKTAFLSGMLATYISYASDLTDIKNKNVNLNFDVASLPQLRTGGTKAGYARMYGFSLVRSSPRLDVSYQVLSVLTEANNIQKLSQSMYAPSIRRDVIALGSNDPYITIFNNSALVSKTWLDIDNSQSKQIFANLIQTITSGKSSIEQAVKDAKDLYDVKLKQVQ
jgi:ABC-type glycerol-3-phosphate transport system substrate-binding protein